MNDEQNKRHTEGWTAAFKPFTTKQLQEKLSELDRVTATDYDDAIIAELDYEIHRRERIPMSKRVK